MLTCGQRALARISYLESTRAKAQLNRDQADQFYTGNLANFAPGLTLAIRNEQNQIARDVQDICEAQGNW